MQKDKWVCNFRKIFTFDQNCKICCLGPPAHCQRSRWRNDSYSNSSKNDRKRSEIKDNKGNKNKWPFFPKSWQTWFFNLFQINGDDVSGIEPYTKKHQNSPTIPHMNVQRFRKKMCLAKISFLGRRTGHLFHFTGASNVVHRCIPGYLGVSRGTLRQFRRQRIEENCSITIFSVAR